MTSHEVKALMTGREIERDARRYELENLTFGKVQSIRQKLLNDGKGQADDKAFGIRTDVIEWIVDTELPSLIDTTVDVVASFYPMPFEHAGDRTRDKYIRAGVKMNSDNGASIDIVRNDGSFFCRLNISIYGDGNGCVDFILEDTQQPRLLAWSNYDSVADQMLASGSLVAVEIKEL